MNQQKWGPDLQKVNATDLIELAPLAPLDIASIPSPDESRVTFLALGYRLMPPRGHCSPSFCKQQAPLDGYRTSDVPDLRVHASCALWKSLGVEILSL